MAGEDREKLDPILDACVVVYQQDLDEDGQVQFKRQAKGFLRTYAFLSSVLPYNNAEWEERSIFLNFLVSKLPSPREEDLSKGILDAIDMDSYRVEKRAMQKILLPDEEAEIDPSSDFRAGGCAEPEMDLLSNIIKVEKVTVPFFALHPTDHSRRPPNEVLGVRRVVTEPRNPCSGSDSWGPAGSGGINDVSLVANVPAGGRIASREGDCSLLTRAWRSTLNRYYLQTAQGLKVSAIIRGQREPVVYRCGSYHEVKVADKHSRCSQTPPFRGECATDFLVQWDDMNPLE